MEWYTKEFSQLDSYEIYEILKIRVDVFVVEQKCPYYEVDNKDLKSVHIFAKKDNKMIAYLRILPPGVSFKEVSIGRVLVTKAYRGREIGRHLMEKGMTYIMKHMNQNTIRISAQEYLKTFYESLGFTTVSKSYLEDDIPHIEMLYSNKKSI